MPKLGVNVDHVATLRQARRELEPDPITAAKICEKAGADGIVAHLREDRRHMNENDIKKLCQVVKKNFNLELSLNKEIVQIASRLNPDEVMFVPERRQEVTTEGGLDVIKYSTRIQKATQIFKKKNILVSFFVDPAKRQIEAAKKNGADIVELHTGPYAHAKNKQQLNKELTKLKEMAAFAKSLDLKVAAGHGLKYDNTKAVARIKDIEELNIGHSIISRAVFVGLEQAVKEMLKIIK